jgi:hypothetical protein
MGRPKKNRRKAPEEKLVKGKIVFTKAGGQIHCSICGRPGHNKKGHMKFMQSLAEDQQNGIIGEDQDFDMPEILQVSTTTFLILHHSLACLLCFLCFLYM